MISSASHPAMWPTWKNPVSWTLISAVGQVILLPLVHLSDWARLFCETESFIDLSQRQDGCRQTAARA